MSKKGIKIHQKSVPGRLYQAGRLEGGAKTAGSRSVRKPKQSSK
jgi:hypothetical protein